MPEINSLVIIAKQALVAAVFLKREYCRLAEWTGFGYIGTGGLSAAFVCIMAAIITLIRGYVQTGSIILSMVLGLGLTVSLLVSIVSLKTPGGVEEYYAAKNEELLRLQEQYAETRARIESEREAVHQRTLQEQAQQDVQIIASEESSGQQVNTGPSSEVDQVIGISTSTATPAMDSITCPKCGSTQVTVQKKGFGGGCACCGALLVGPLGLLCGLHGANKVIITCLKCGNQWSRG